MCYILTVMLAGEKSFFKLSQISKKFSNVYIEKVLHISGPMQFKSLLFKSKLCYNPQDLPINDPIGTNIPEK